MLRHRFPICLDLSTFCTVQRSSQGGADHLLKSNLNVAYLSQRIGLLKRPSLIHVRRARSPIQSNARATPAGFISKLSRHRMNIGLDSALEHTFHIRTLDFSVIQVCTLSALFSLRPGHALGCHKCPQLPLTQRTISFRQCLDYNQKGSIECLTSSAICSNSSRRQDAQKSLRIGSMMDFVPMAGKGIPH